MVTRKLLFTLTALLTLMLSPVQAQEGPARDLRVVVDISGSMKLNDPENLRRPAIRLLAGLLPDDTSVGLWTFGREVNMLVPHGALNDSQRDALTEGSGKINSVAQRTSIGAAIEEASDDWYAPDRSLETTHLILLSDGKVDIDPSAARNDQERERILQELVPGLAAEGLTIHTIALSAEADLDLLGAIADHTGGGAHVAGTADELSRIFADILGDAVPANEIPLEDNGFTVDQGVEEFTALIFSNTDPQQRELVLVSPEGDRYTTASADDGLRWVREPGYDLITADQPVAGDWQVEGTLGDGSRVTVVSDLRLEVDPLPARFGPDDSIEVQAYFTEEGERVTDADFLRVIELRLSITTEDGREGTRTLSADQPPEDGVYQDTVSQLQEPGQYRLELVADGGTFSRKFRKTLTLEAPEGEPSTPTTIETVPLPDEGQDRDLPGEQAGSGPEAEGPIDISEVQEPEPEPESPEPPEDEPSPAAEAEVTDNGWLPSWWPWAAAGAGLLLLGLVAILLVRRRRRGEDESGTAAEPAEEAPKPQPAAVSPGPESQEASEDALAEESGEAPPVVDEDVDAAGEEEPAMPSLDDLPEQPEGADTEETSSDAIADNAEPEPEPEPKPEPGPEPDAVTGTEVPEEPDDAPETESAGTEEEAASEARREDDPGLDDFDDSVLEDDGDEFGLEDFDLSDIDDLPDLEPDEEEEKRRKPPEDGDRGRE